MTPTRLPYAHLGEALGDLVGGNGILLENHVMRHMADSDAIHMFEGAKTMQALIVGRDVTGIGAFA